MKALMIRSDRRVPSQINLREICVDAENRRRALVTAMVVDS